MTPRRSLTGLTFALFFLGILVVLGILAQASFFQVHQTQSAIVQQFGDPRRVITEPGLNVKLPFIQNVIFIDRRILDLDLPAEELIAADQKRLVVDAYARYRIKDPLMFYKALRSENRARSRLTATVSSTMRSVLGGENFKAVVRDRRDDLMRMIRASVNEQAADFGIEIIDVRILRADLPVANSQAVYRRMQTERAQEAAEFRGLGQQVSRGLRAEADKQVAVLLAEAARDGEIIRGQGDGCRNRVFAAVFGRDPDFFTFYRAMKAYAGAFSEGGGDATVVMSPEGGFFRYFNDPDASPLSRRRASPTADASEADVSRLLKEGGSLSDVLCPEIRSSVE